jgi:hypothetical protein
MKKIFLLIAAFTALLFTSCSKDDSVEISFGKTTYAMLADGSVDVELKVTEPASSDITIPVTFGGSAVINDEYTVSANEFVIKSGTSSAIITLSPKNNLTAGKEITITLSSVPKGYKLGLNPTTIVTLDKKELIICSFSTDKTDLLDEYTITAILTGETSGDKFTATTDMIIPLKLESTNITLGKEFEIVGGGNLELKVAAGTNKGTLRIKSKDISIGETESLVLSIDKEKAGARFILGDYGKITISLKGVLKLSNIVGTWTFDKIIELEEIQLWAEEMEDDPELLPYRNSGFTLEIKCNEDGTYSLIPGGTKGDFSNFFVETGIEYGKIVNPIKKYVTLGDYCTEEPFMWTANNIQLTYFKLAKANKAFSSSNSTIGESTIALRIDENGNLEVHFRDYNEPPFMTNWWSTPFDPDMFGFASVFKKN